MIAATLIWGGAFSVQRTGMRFVDPVLFTALRSALGALALALFTIAFDVCRGRGV